MVSVITIKFATTQTRAFRAYVGNGAVVVIVAWVRIIFEGAADGWIADIGCADVTIITVWTPATDTGSLGAGVFVGAGVLVIARLRVWNELTVGGCVADVICTWVTVVTALDGAADAGPATTEVVEGAVVSITTGADHIIVLTASARKAEIVGAWVSIITHQGSGSYAEPFLTSVELRTFVIVVTGRIGGKVEAGPLWITNIVGAGVSIITVHGRAARYAASFGAAVAQSTGVGVIAWRVIWAR
tara:strand:- start:1897 stop:2628 length:732 start_codon:yes stop_codon:yes gene_type:complete